MQLVPTHRVISIFSVIHGLACMMNCYTANCLIINVFIFIFPGFLGHHSSSVHHWLNIENVFDCWLSSVDLLCLVEVCMFGSYKAHYPFGIYSCGWGIHNFCLRFKVRIDSVCHASFLALLWLFFFNFNIFKEHSNRVKILSLDQCIHFVFLQIYPWYKCEHPSVHKKLKSIAWDGYLCSSYRQRIKRVSQFFAVDFCVSMFLRHIR